MTPAKIAREDDPHRWGDLKRLLTETGRLYIWRYAVALVLLGVVSATTAATAWLMKDVINEVFIAKSQSALIFVAVAVLVIYLARGAASYGQGVILTKIGNSIVANGQERLTKKLLQDDVASVLSRTSSEIVQKQVMAADSARQLLLLFVTIIGRDVLTLLGLIGVMLVQDPLVSSVVLLALPIAAVLVGRLGKRMRGVVRRQVVLGVSLADQLRQVIQGFRIVKAFGMEAKMGARLAETIEEQRRNNDRGAVLHARSQPIVETLAGVAVALVILYGGWRVIGEGATPGAFFSFITALLLAYDPARRLAGARVQMEQGLTGLRIFYEMIDAKPAVVDRPDALPLADPRGAVRYDNVSFAYVAGQPILGRLDLVIEAGKTTAIVGASGSGKSTLLSLLLRFWHPQTGAITIGGQDIESVTAESLRAGMAYVGQDSFLFDGTIRENILVGAPGADQAAIEAAARAAQAHDFIAELPEGYETPVGELASRFSGGQKQRIAIARAFLRNAPLLLLDEPTAALDAQSEEALRQTLADLAEGRTTILLAHRLASVMRADKIVALENGRVVEEGTHAELLAAGGLYARLYRMQVGEG
ncbi:MAG: ATP-binding cassette subfamily B [Beijerinckiaceae bacterium]|nr:MAG: ATP-binding cassette subfamily B [Beijerinckiaceae bacterium]